MELEFKHVPTLVVGLGGTGNEIARRLKSKFAARYPEQDSLIRYLVMDTDRKSFRDGFWDREEQVFLRLSLMPRHILSAFYNNEHADWLPQEPRINPDHFVNQESGAGLIRPIGRLYVQDQVAQVRDRLEKAKNSLSDLAERMRTKTILSTGDFQVYVVGSLAGGTGCGAFLDVATLVRELFEENCFITGLFTLYPCYSEVLRGDVDQARRSKANCYAALKELEFFMQEKDDTQPHLYNIKFWDGSRASLYKRLFNICYLVENTNDAGAKLNNLQQIYELCAQQLFHEIGSPLGEDYRSKINNLSFFQSGLSGEEWRDWGRKRRFSSFGNVSLVFPRDKVMRYCSNRFTKELVELALGRVKGDPPETRLLKSLNIADWHDRPVVLEEEIASQMEQLLDYRLGDASEDLDRLLAHRIEEVEQNFAAQCGQLEFTRLKATWWEALKQEVGRVLQAKGVVATLRALQALEQQFRAAQEHWLKLLERSRQDYSSLGSELGKLRAELRGLGFFAKFSRGKLLSQHLIDTYHAWLEVKLEKQVLAKLIELLSDFGVEIARQQAQADNLYYELSGLQEQAEKALEELYFVDRNADPTVLIQEVVTEQDCIDFYLSHRPKEMSMVLKRLWEGDLSSVQQLILELGQQSFQGPLQDMGIVQFLRQKFGPQGKEAWNELLDELREICRPFWTVRLKHGEYYNQTCLVGLAKEGENFPAEVVAWAKDRSDATRGIDCVNTYYPEAIDITVCSHGAYAGYLSGMKDYYAQYEQFLRNREFPVHLHEQFRHIGELDPYQDLVGQFFALAGAYGLIAERTEGYFFSLNRGALGWEFRSKTQATVKPANWEELQERPFPAQPLKADPSFLGVTRASAQSNLGDSSTYVSLINSFFQERITQFGKEQVKKELEEYAGRLVGESGDKFLGQEAQALKVFLNAHLNQERVYG